VADSHLDDLDAGQRDARGDVEGIAVGASAASTHSTTTPTPNQPFTAAAARSCTGTREPSCPTGAALPAAPLLS
jgi:hypothetical protein